MPENTAIPVLRGLPRRVRPAPDPVHRPVRPRMDTVARRLSELPPGSASSPPAGAQKRDTQARHSALRPRSSSNTTETATRALATQITQICTAAGLSRPDSTAAQIGGDARVAHDQGRSLTAIDVSARSDSERRIGVRGRRASGTRLCAQPHADSARPPGRLLAATDLTSQVYGR